MSDQLDMNLDDDTNDAVLPRAEVEADETLGDASEEASDDTPAQKFGKRVGTIAALLAKEGAMSTGARAELRRISPQNPYTPALWKLLYDQDLHEPWLKMDQDVYERRMATLLMGMAHCAGLHQYNVPLGRALAEAGWSELRFVKLMEARGETLEVHVRRMAQYLASKGQSANWVDVGWLLLGQDRDSAQETRLRISRSYYGTLHALSTQD